MILFHDKSKRIHKQVQTQIKQRKEEANASDTSKAIKKLFDGGDIDFSLDKERTPADVQELTKRRSLSVDATNLKIHPKQALTHQNYQNTKHTA